MARAHLLGSRRFGPLFGAGVLGALNDNLFRNAIVIPLAFRASGSGVLSSEQLIHLGAGIFVLPFFLFSAIAGKVADRVEKSRLIRAIKLAEVFIMGLASIGFLVDSVALLLGVLFLMGTQSAFFGPVKYSIVPQHLRREELVSGNGWIEMGTFAAIVLGTLLGGVLGTMPHAGSVVSSCLVALAVAGYLASRRIPEAPSDAAVPVSFRLFRETVDCMKLGARRRPLFLAVLGISWFWLFGAFLLSELPSLVAENLGGGPAVATLLLAGVSLGIGVGSLLASLLSGGRVELGLVPWAGLGMSVAAVDLFGALENVARIDGVGLVPFLQSPAHLRVLVDLSLVGALGGLFVVPLYAFLQEQSDANERSQILAANNIFNAAFMVVASLGGVVLRALGVSHAAGILFLAVLNAAVALVALRWVLAPSLRLVVRALVRTVYRLRVSGVENIPSEGAAVLVCNHVTFVDALVLTAASPRPIRFVMDHRIFENPILHPIFRLARAIPVASRRADPALMERAFEDIESALGAGELVCIFPEGQLTYDGEIARFRPGVNRILQTTPVPVVPMALRGLWGSFFSRQGGKAMRRFPRRVRAAIELVAAPAVAAGEAGARHLETRVRELRGQVA